MTVKPSASSNVMTLSGGASAWPGRAQKTYSPGCRRGLMPCKSTGRDDSAVMAARWVRHDDLLPRQQEVGILRVDQSIAVGVDELAPVWVDLGVGRLLTPRALE